jgi:hypothetical protein
MPARRIGVRLIVFLSLVVTPAQGEMPYPANPDPCDPIDPTPGCTDATDFGHYLFLPATVPLTLPNDFGADNWKLTSERTGDPAIDDSPQELFGVKGAGVDLAWQTTTGRPDVLIAVLDSGIRWQDALPDVVNKFQLNRGELPVPEGSDNAADPYDRNRDAVFNVADYAGDSRVSDQNGNGVVDPEDLIFLFSDGVDDDGNGYADDISGWDFFEDDNDALDEVRYGTTAPAIRAPARTACCWRCASATASSPRPTPSRAASPSPSTVGRTSSRRLSARSTRRPSASKPSTTPTETGWS